MLSTLYLRNRDGATHQLSGARLKKLRKAVLAGVGGTEIAAYADEYEGFIGNDGQVQDLDSLDAYFQAGN